MRVIIVIIVTLLLLPVSPLSHRVFSLINFFASTNNSIACDGCDLCYWHLPPFSQALTSAVHVIVSIWMLLRAMMLKTSRYPSLNGDDACWENGAKPGWRFCDFQFCEEEFLCPLRFGGVRFYEFFSKAPPIITAKPRAVRDLNLMYVLTNPQRTVLSAYVSHSLNSAIPKKAANIEIVRHAEMSHCDTHRYTRIVRNGLSCHCVIHEARRPLQR